MPLPDMTPEQRKLYEAERSLIAAEAAGIILRKLFIFAICIVGIIALLYGRAPAKSQPVPVKVEQVQVKLAKPVKHRIRQAKKKCACECKKVVDKPAKHVYKVIINNEEVELTQ